MWLINCCTLELKEIPGTPKDPYAVLSHTWEAEEVTFQDFTGKGWEQKKGAQKIFGTCKQAERDGFQFLWIDSCCIDKRSSAELTESINSMYRIYQRSERCYVYLGDFVLGQTAEEFGKCLWFTRGWTLQELLAPKLLYFYDRDWQYCGSKSDLDISISKITGIRLEYITGVKDIHSAPVAQRMAWASRRKTTREEDMAYCLLGIFKIHMPLIYGEGALNAFIRLQETIIKETNDMSIFAWQDFSGSGSPRGVFARSPAEFSHAASITRLATDVSGVEFTMTNKGLRIETELKIFGFQQPLDHFFLLLDCYQGAEEAGQTLDLIGILLQEKSRGVYERIPEGSMWLMDEWTLRDSKAKLQKKWGPLYVERETRLIYIIKDSLDSDE